jgi:uncharacterized lipoprotein YddW (UPF0748 family)
VGDGFVADAAAEGDGAPGDGAVSDAAPDDAGMRADLLPLRAPRELRGVWVSTVYNLDFPSRSGLSAAAARAELARVVDRTAAAGLNAIFFQVRPESDALYASSIEPWSRFLTGTQGRDPGWDPLAELLALAHARGVEVHAWLNPYRGLANASTPAAPNHVTRTLSAHAIPYGGAIVMDPGAAPVRAHVVAVVADLLARYDVDGLHFDDYFYPYPDADRTPFPDGASYDAYLRSGGTLSLGDWRRANVDTLVREVSELVATFHPHVRFGISPFGIYRPGMPPGITGLDAYATIHCDAPKWMREGWVDYLAPQLYWPTTQTAQAYGALAVWWSMQLVGGRHLFPGHALYRLGSSAAWTRDELRLQVEITRGLADAGALGDVHFRYAQVAADTEGIAALFASSLYAEPAIAPVVPRAGASETPAPPRLERRRDGGLALTHPRRAEVRFFTLWQERGGAFGLVRLLSADTTELSAAEIGPGRVAVGAVARGGGESDAALAP